MAPLDGDTDGVHQVRRTGDEELHPLPGSQGGGTMVNITRQNRDTVDGRWALLFRERPDIERIEVTADDLTVWFSFSDEPFPFSSLRNGSSLKSWLEACWNDMSVVCVTHQRFAPCRVGDGCIESIEPDDVERVRRWQTGD